LKTRKDDHWDQSKRSTTNTRKLHKKKEINKRRKTKQQQSQKKWRIYIYITKRKGEKEIVISGESPEE
jgi:hypothetical protein